LNWFPALLSEIIDEPSQAGETVNQMYKHTESMKNEFLFFIMISNVSFYDFNFIILKK